MQGIFSRPQKTSNPPAPLETTKPSFVAKKTQGVGTQIGQELVGVVTDFLSEVHKLPNEDLSRLKTYIQQKNKEEATRLCETLGNRVNTDLKQAIQQEQWHSAIEQVTLQIQTQEGHLAKITQATSQLLPHMLIPSIDTILSRFDSFLLSSPPSCLQQAYLATNKVSLSMSQGLSISEEVAREALQGLNLCIQINDQLPEKIRFNADEMSKMQALSQQSDVSAWTTISLILSKHYELSCGLADKLIDRMASKGKEWLMEGLAQFKPQIVSSHPQEDTIVNVSMTEMLQPSPPPMLKELDQANLGRLICDQSKLLSNNVASTIMIQLVVCKIAQLPLSQDKYYEMLDQSSRPDGDLQNLVFGYLDYVELNFLHRWLCKAVYIVSAPLVRFFTGHFIHNAINYVLNIIKRHDADQYESMLTECIQAVNEHLSNLNEAYSVVAGEIASKGPSPQLQATGTLEQRLQAELNFPAYRAGMTKTEFYQAVQAKLIDTFCPRIDINALFNRFSTSWRFASTHKLAFLNTAIEWTLWLLSGIIKIAVFIPETCFNWLVRFAIKQVPLPTQPLDLLDDSFIYSVTQFLLYRLQEAWHYMRETNSTLESTLPAAASRELSAVVENFFLSLQLSQIQKIDDLRRFVQSNQPLQFLHDIINSLIKHKITVIDASTKYMASLLRSLIQKRQLGEIIYFIISAFNEQIFTAQTSPSPAEIRNINNEILLLMNEIFGSALQESLLESLKPAVLQQREIEHVLSSIFNCFGELSRHLDSNPISAWLQWKNHLREIVINAGKNPNINAQSQLWLNSVFQELQQMMQAIAPYMTTLQSYDLVSTTIMHLETALSQKDKSALLSQITLFKQRFQKLPFDIGVAENLTSMAELLDNFKQIVYQVSIFETVLLELLPNHNISSTWIQLLPIAQQTKDALLAISDTTAQQTAIAQTCQSLYQQALTSATQQQKQLISLLSQAEALLINACAASSTNVTELKDTMLTFQTKYGVSQYGDDQPAPWWSRYADLNEAMQIGCQQIKAQMANVPSFIKKDYNIEGFISHFLLRFLNQA